MKCQTNPCSTFPLLTHGSLFSGIGGFDLGMERAGIKTLWQVEIEEYPRMVLARHFPDAERYADIRDCYGMWTNHRRKHYLQEVDVISGGFPCQDISHAGKGVGIEGERSGLWAEMWRVVCEIRPRYIIVENVAALLGRGIGRVLADLAKSGYDAEWDCLPAIAFGAPHRRDRVFLVAYQQAHAEGQSERSGLCENQPRGKRGRRSGDRSGTDDVSDASQSGLSLTEQQTVFGARRWQEGRAIAQCDWWAVEPDVGRVAHGVPARVDRLKALGNAVVPQIAEWIGNRIVEYERQRLNLTKG